MGSGGLASPRQQRRAPGSLRYQRPATAGPGDPFRAAVTAAITTGRSLDEVAFGAQPVLASGSGAQPAAGAGGSQGREGAVMHVQQQGKVQQRPASAMPVMRAGAGWGMGNRQAHPYAGG
jgi:hypothetical protein